MPEGIVDNSSLIILILFCVAMAWIKPRIVSLRQRYERPGGDQERQAINRRFRLNALGVVILVLVSALYLLTVAFLMHQFSFGFFWCVISLLLLLPFATVALLLYGLLTFFIHLLNAPK